MSYKELADVVEAQIEGLIPITKQAKDEHRKVREAAAILLSLDAQEPFGHVSGSVDVDGDFYKRVAIAEGKQWPKHGTAVYAAPVAAPQSLDAQPVAWGLFAKVEDGYWALQHPVRFTEEDAKADRTMYEKSTLIDIRPLYAAPVAAQPTREQAQRERMEARQASRAPSPTTADFDLPAQSDEVAAQPTEQDALRKRIKAFPTNHSGDPIIYDTNEIDLITYALTGDDGEDDSVTVLQRLVRALSGKTAYNLLEEAETAAQPQQTKPLSVDWLWAELMDWCKLKGYSPASQCDLFAIVSKARVIEAAHRIKEQE